MASVIFYTDEIPNLIIPLRPLSDLCIYLSNISTWLSHKTLKTNISEVDPCVHPTGAPVSMRSANTSLAVVPKIYELLSP